VIRYAAQAVPWVRLAVSLGLVVLLTEVARLWPGPTWGMLAVAVGVLAGSAAWCADEPAARVVDTAPRGLAWRTAARLPALLLLGCVWVLQVSRSWDQLYGHGTELLVQGLAALAVAIAWTAWRRAHGVARPGSRFATAVLPVTMVTAMVGPVAERLWVFPFAIDPETHWQVSHAGWTTAGVLALVVLAAALTDAPWWHLRRKSAQLR
jgi:hypothetical protein